MAAKSTLRLWVAVIVVVGMSIGRAVAQVEPDIEDTTPPTVPGGLLVTAKTAYSISFSWNPSSDSGGSGLAGYDIYNGANLIGSTSSTAFTQTGLAEGIVYTYQVAAYDNDDNASSKSVALSVKTNVRGDLSGDGKVNAVDLSIVLSRYGKNDASASAGDVDGNGVVSAVDLSIVLSKYGFGT